VILRNTQELQINRLLGVRIEQEFKDVTKGIYVGNEREIYFKSHISLWEHSSHFRLIGRGVPSVSVVSQLMYKFLCLASPKENPQVPM